MEVFMIEKCGKCAACRIERTGFCACDGSLADDGCFLCIPSRHKRPPCIRLLEPMSDERLEEIEEEVNAPYQQTNARETEVLELLEEVKRLRGESIELFASLPKCCFSYECKNIGVKWIARTHLHCDTHGSIYDQDAPWAALVRHRGLSGKSRPGLEPGLVRSRPQ